MTVSTFSRDILQVSKQGYKLLCIYEVIDILSYIYLSFVFTPVSQAYKMGSLKFRSISGGKTISYERERLFEFANQN